MATATSVEKTILVHQKKKEMLFKRMQDLYDQSIKARSDNKFPTSLISGSRCVGLLRAEFIACVDKINELSLMSKEKFTPSYAEVESFELLFCEVNEMFHYIISIQESASSEKMKQSSNKYSASNKLPPIRMPMFNGTPEQWPIFYQVFMKLVHENPAFSDIEKVTHLITHLEGSARSVCTSVPPTAENYELLLKTLKDRFEDQRMLASAYFEKIFNFKTLTVESQQSLDNFLCNFVEPVNALKQMNIEDLADYLFLHLALKKLDNTTARSYENIHRSNNTIPPFKSLVEFVTEQAKILSRETCKNTVSTSKLNHSNFSKTYNLNQNVLLTRTPVSTNVTHSQSVIAKKTSSGCALCSSADVHPLYMCAKFKQLQVNDRWEMAKSHKICFNCLSPFHLNNFCNSISKCRVDGCGKRHHSLLHRVESSPKLLTPQQSQESNPTQTLCSIDVAENLVAPSTVLLATVTVISKDSQGVTQELRGILDSGSQSNFLTRKACLKLGLSTDPIRSVVRGIGASPMNISACTVWNFHSRIDPTHNYFAHALVVERLSDNIPSVEISPLHLSHLFDLPLADVSFYKPAEIDFLLGAEFWPLIVGTKSVSGNSSSPVALETTLGYVVMGRSALACTKNISESHCFFSQPSLDSLVNKFWSLEEVPTRKLLSEEDTICENFFLKTYTRNADGTFTVRLPFRKPSSLLGSSKNASTAKYISLERRLLVNPTLHNLYSSVINEYIEDGTITRIGFAKDFSDEGAYYMPHHGVYRSEHSTTPLRIVFNASAPTSTSLSLNQLLYVGPKLQADIFEVLIHFRLFKFVMTSDIRRMFLQIDISKEDRRFQRFFWRKDPSQPIDVYEINKVVFGSTSSPYLANRVVRLLAELEKDNFPMAAAVAQRDVYVDDVVTSVNNEVELLELQKQLVAMFLSGGFTLSKWSSNSTKLLEQIPEGSRLLPFIDFDRESSSKVLGVQWSPGNDCFSCVVDNCNLPCTKRNVLSVTARIFDPLGLVAPVTLVAKLIIKQLWCNGSDWDDPPPPAIVNEWIALKNALPLLKNISFHRHIGVAEGTRTTLIGFADSSTKAYGACVYIRSEISDMPIEVNLLCAKSRIAPSSHITIPRLELCAALLLSRLMRNIIDSYHSRHTFDSVVAFTDSKVVLHWVHSDASRWKIFVGNRVAQIQENISANNWRHVRGEDNPADVLSRGASPEALLKHEIWFHGPHWLRFGESQWPKSFNNDIIIPENEAKLTSLLVVTPHENVLSPLLDRISSFRKLIRITAYVFRICTRSNLGTPFIRLEEMNRSLAYWIKCVQNSTYPAELMKLRRGEPITSHLQNLCPFLHEGIIRVGGRLQNSSLAFEEKHPILLPGKGKFVDLLIDQYHLDLLHGGQQLILTSLRQKYWIPAAITRIRSRIHKCNICFRSRPRPILPKMAPLPSFRVETSRVFERTGVDYAGPFLITPYRRKGKPFLRKSYVCLFICLSVKAVHIELASDLSTDGFMAAYKRFLSRRGPCSLLLSDGGSNFIGARKLMTELETMTSSVEFQSQVGNEMASRGVEWRINPAYGPWFGGIWESNIKCIKNHLRRVIGEQTLTYEEFNTVLIQVEAIMNSRPLCVLHSDPNSLTALTPAHFLTVGTSLENLPTQDLRKIQTNRLSRYQLVDRLVQDYWIRWQREYLHTLQSRAKWTRDTTPIKEGTVVVLLQDHVLPLRWPLGIIDSVHPGGDGVVRVVTVRTSSGVYRRPVGKICPLPTQ